MVFLCNERIFFFLISPYINMTAKLFTSEGSRLQTFAGDKDHIWELRDSSGKVCFSGNATELDAHIKAQLEAGEYSYNTKRGRRKKSGQNIQTIEAVGQKFAIINKHIENGTEVPSELTKNFVTFPLSDKPLTDKD